MNRQMTVIWAVVLLFVGMAYADSTNAWVPDSLHFVVQSPYDLKRDARYGFDAKTQTHHLWVYDTDKSDTKSSTRPPRTEMSFDKYTSGQHQLEADVLVVTNTSRVSIMQIFGAEGRATSLQLRVYDGDLKEYEHATLLSGVYGKWFHLNVTHDVETHEITVLIDGKLVLTTKDNGGKEWHFKCGVYAQEKPSRKMEVYYRNIKIYKQ